MVGDPFKIKQGDTRATYVVQLRENIGSTDPENPERAIDFTEADSVAIIMKSASAGVSDPPKLDKKPAAFLTPRTEGEVEYVWEAGDLDTVDDFDVEWFIVWEPGAEETIPNDDYFRVEVKQDLD